MDVEMEGPGGSITRLPICSNMAVAAIASADEANGWLKPEKNGKEEKEAKGEAPDSH